MMDGRSERKVTHTVVQRKQSPPRETQNLVFEELERYKEVAT